MLLSRVFFLLSSQVLFQFMFALHTLITSTTKHSGEWMKLHMSRAFHKKRKKKILMNFDSQRRNSLKCDFTAMLDSSASAVRLRKFMWRSRLYRSAEYFIGFMLISQFFTSLSSERGEII